MSTIGLSHHEIKFLGNISYRSEIREPITRIQKLEVILSILVNYYWVKYHLQIQKLRVRAITYFADKSEYNMLWVVSSGVIHLELCQQPQNSSLFPRRATAGYLSSPCRLLHEAPLYFPTTWLDSRKKSTQESWVKM